MTPSDDKQQLETQVRERTKKLQESEEKFHSLYRAMDEGVALNELIFDEEEQAVDFRFLDVNRAFERLFSVEKREIVNTLASDLFGTKEVPYIDIFSIAAQSQETVSFEAYFDIFDKHFSISAFTHSKGRFAIFFFDITNLKHAENLIRRQKQMYQTTLESLTYPFCVIDANDFTVSMSNSAATNRAAPGASHCYAMLHGRDNPCNDTYYPCPLETVKKTLEPVVVEHVYQKDGGETFYAEVHGYPIFDDDGNLVQMIEYSLDITERKKMQRRLQQAADTIRRQWQQLEKELNAAKDIQMSMLRTDFPEPPGCDAVSMYASVEPAKEVGGDFYDFFFIDDEHLCVNIGDVSDKGVPAALFMALTKALIKSRASDEHSTARIVSHVNDEISSRNDQNMFITAFVAILNIRTGKLTYTNAGHNPPYVKNKKGDLLRLANLHGPVIGAIPGLAYKEEHVQLDPGDFLLLYTDGVTEAMDREESLYSEGRLKKLLYSGNFNTPRTFIELLLSDIEDFTAGAAQSDDITVLGLQYLARTIVKSPEEGKSTVSETDRLADRDGSMVPAPKSALRIRMNNTHDSLRQVQEHLQLFAQHHAVPPKIAQRISIIMDELLNNIIVYAFGDTDEFQGIDKSHHIDKSLDTDKPQHTDKSLDTNKPQHTDKSLDTDKPQHINKSHVIDVAVELDDDLDKMIVTVSDAGMPFNPLEKEDPDVTLSAEERSIGGLGILLVRRLSEELSYRREQDRNVVTFIMPLQDSNDPDTIDDNESD